MSNWNIPSRRELKHDAPPPAWVPVALLIFCVIVGTVFAVLDWKPGTPVSSKFVVGALLVPSLLGGLASAALYAPYEGFRDKVEWLNFRVKHAFMNWRYWSQWNAAVIDSVILTPEVDLAERMLGLEGKPPENAGETLTLDVGTPADPARLDQLIDKLVTPLVGHLKRVAGKEAVNVMVSAPGSVTLEAVHAALEKIGMPGLYHGNLNFLPPDEVADLLTAFVNGKEWEWNGKRKRPFAMSLVLAFQLHEQPSDQPNQQPNDASGAPTFSESAAAVLLASAHVVRDYKLKPQARLFRPATAALNELPDRLDALLTAAPTPIDKLKHVWISGLTKLARNNVNGTLDAVEREWARHDLDQAIGKPGPASPWLMQALAAQMVTYGQGPQLVVTPARQGVTLNLVGAAYSEVTDVPMPQQNWFPVSAALMIACTCGLLMTAVLSENLGAWAIGIFVVMVLLMLVGLPLMMLSFYRRLDDEFDRAASR